MSTEPTLGLAITTYNERASIGALLNSLVLQTVKPAAIVICDAGSKDGTVEIIQQYTNRLPIEIIIQPGASIAQGRNKAIEKLTTPLIAVTDGGCTADPRWLEILFQGFQSPTHPDVVSGWYYFVGTSWREKSFALLHATDVSKITSETFLPSSRSVAFRRAAWAAVGGYPEWLTFAAEDTLFGLKLRQQGFSFLFAPDAIVHWNMRSTFRDIFHQYRRYGYGDAETGLRANVFIVKSIIILSGSIGLGMGYIDWRWTAGTLLTMLLLLLLPLLRKTLDPRLIALGTFGKIMTFSGQYIGYFQGLVWGKRKP